MSVTNHLPGLAPRNGEKGVAGTVFVGLGEGTWEGKGLDPAMHVPFPD